MPSNKQQTIAFFISAPASRPLPPPVPLHKQVGHLK